MVALPPAFPPIRIGGELYWDGGILSNTPVEAVFGDNPRRNALVFAVHVWNPNGPEPRTMADIANRQKDVQYASLRIPISCASSRSIVCATLWPNSPRAFPRRSATLMKCAK